jgi:CheY-like chemotaxis protein
MHAPRILVIDDNSELRESLVEVLRDHGCAVVEAANGSEGLKLLRCQKKKIDLVVLDLMMPIMNGATFRWHQRLDPSIAKVPVLVLSSVRDGEKSARVLGAAGYLLKPVNPDELMAAVKKLTG